MGEVRFRFDSRGQGRYCDVRDGAERCDAAFTYDSVSMTYVPDDPAKRGYRAVLIEPDIFAQYEGVDGVKFGVLNQADTGWTPTRSCDCTSPPCSTARVRAG